MSHPVLTNHQRGATLIVALIMLLLFTLLVSGAFRLSGTNLQAVGNMQVREEGLAAAEQAIEGIIPTDFIDAGTQTPTIDINNDGVDDYNVVIQPPACIKVSLAQATAQSSVQLAALSSNTWNTVWEIVATATDQRTSTSVTIRTGIRVLLTDALKNAHCS